MAKAREPARLDPFAIDDLADFQPAPAARPKVDEIRAVSEASNFPSRAAKPKLAAAATPRVQRRHRTGRSVQINIKATPETIERLTSIADRQGWVFGETLEHALDALETKLKATK